MWIRGVENMNPPLKASQTRQSLARVFSGLLRLNFCQKRTEFVISVGFIITEFQLVYFPVSDWMCPCFTSIAILTGH